jgi:FKBP-type peptidyl-prolyl cis-trans isomerase
VVETRNRPIAFFLQGQGLRPLLVFGVDDPSAAEGSNTTQGKRHQGEPILEDELMNKLLVALFASAFVCVSASALAQTKPAPLPAGGADNTMLPLSKMSTEEAKAARAAANAKWAQMTPEERAAAKKATQAKNQASWTAVDETASGITYNQKKAAADAAAAKAQPAPTKAERVKEGAVLSKEASKGGGN